MYWESTLEVVRQTAREYDISLWQSAQKIMQTNSLPARACNALNAFLNLIDNIETATEGYEPGELTEYMLHQTGLLEHYRKEKSEKDQMRIENLEDWFLQHVSFVLKMMKCL